MHRSEPTSHQICTSRQDLYKLPYRNADVTIIIRCPRVTSVVPCWAFANRPIDAYANYSHKPFGCVAFFIAHAHSAFDAYCSRFNYGLQGIQRLQELLPSPIMQTELKVLLFVGLSFQTYRSRIVKVVIRRRIRNYKSSISNTSTTGFPRRLRLAFNRSIDFVVNASKLKGSNRLRDCIHISSAYTSDQIRTLSTID